jgi:hypothetical protein
MVKVHSHMPLRQHINSLIMLYMSDMDVGTSLRSMIASMALLLLNGTIASDLRWRCCSQYNGIVAILKLVSSPLS